jgi:hypothetical protein
MTVEQHEEVLHFGDWKKAVDGLDGEVKTEGFRSKRSCD